LLHNRGTVAQELILNFQSAVRPANVGLINQLLEVGELYREDCWVVLDPSDKIAIWSAADQVHFWVSGALLPVP
jgi:hypothetical protein